MPCPPIENLLALAERAALVEVQRTDGTTTHGDLLDVRQGCLVLENHDGAVDLVHCAAVASLREVDA